MIRRLASSVFGFAFKTLERLGLHLTPVHFYQPIPLVAALPDSLWNQINNVYGVDLSLEDQVHLLDKFDRFRPSYEGLPRQRVPWRQFYLNNGKFESVDAEILVCMIMYLRPKRIIEVGAGFSTILMAETIESLALEDPEYECTLIAIEPYLSDEFRSALPAFVEVVEKPVESIPLEMFAGLDVNDILFIDSSHVLKIGGDVQYEILQVVPSIAKGVFIHFHDIFIPEEYPKHWVKDRRLFFSEQYLLQAFLAFNDSFEVVWAGSAMRHKFPEHLTASFKSFDSGVRPGSFWIRRIK